MYCKCLNSISDLQHVDAVGLTMWSYDYLQQCTVVHFWGPGVNFSLLEEIFFSYWWTRKRVPNGRKHCSSSWGCCYQICDRLRLFHFTTDRQTSHTDWWQYYPQSYRDRFSS